MYGHRYYGESYFGGRYFGEGGGAAASAGGYFGHRYFGAAYFGPRYFGTLEGEEPPEPPTAVQPPTSAGAGWYRGGRRRFHPLPNIIDDGPGLLFPPDTPEISSITEEEVQPDEIIAQAAGSSIAAMVRYQPISIPKPLPPPVVKPKPKQVVWEDEEEEEEIVRLLEKLLSDEREEDR